MSSIAAARASYIQGSASLRVILQIADQCGVHFPGPADPVQIANGLPQLFGIGPVLVVGPVILRVKLCKGRPCRLACTGAPDPGSIGIRSPNDGAPAARTGFGGRRPTLRGFLGLMTGSSSTDWRTDDEGPAGWEPGWP